MMRRDNELKTLVKYKQLEFINGGWCMHDEASPLWTAMVDQTTRGHQWLFKTFGAECANPRGTWQIDPSDIPIPKLGYSVRRRA